jgi:ABC-type dipeptide transport system, periplasmic component
VLVGGSREAAAILPPGHWAGHRTLAPYEYDPALARALLQQAGIALPLKLVYKTSTDAQRVRLATVMQAQMREAGIQLEIRSLDWGTFFDDVKHGKFQLYGLTWVGIRTPEIYRLAFHSASVPPAGANRGRYEDATTDRLIEAADWQAVSERVHQMLPYVPLWYEGQFVAMRSDLSGYSLKPDGSWDGLATVNKRSKKEMKPQ